MLIGVHESTTALARTSAAFPSVQVTREFEANVIRAQDLVKRVTARCQSAWDAGKTVVWSFKPLPAQVANGDWKPFVTALAEYVKANNLQGKLIVCIWHEPENDFGNPADFVKLYNTVHGWLKDVDPSIKTTHAALGYFYRNISVPTARKWITKADIHSIDLYSGRSFPLSMTLANGKPFKTWKSALPEGAAWGVSERGFIADASKSAERVATIEAEAAYLESLSEADRPAFYVVWNTAGTENDPTIVLDPAGTAAINDMFTRLSRVVCPLCNGTGYADGSTVRAITDAITGKRPA